MSFGNILVLKCTVRRWITRLDHTTASRRTYNQEYCLTTTGLTPQVVSKIVFKAEEEAANVQRFRSSVDHELRRALSPTYGEVGSQSVVSNSAQPGEGNTQPGEGSSQPGEGSSQPGEGNPPSAPPKEEVSETQSPDGVKPCWRPLVILNMVSLTLLCFGLLAFAAEMWFLSNR
jgi:hypothetical protein